MRILEYVPIIIWLLFSMEMRTHGGGSGSGLGAGTKPIDERMREFLSSEIGCDILEQTPVIFGLVEEGIMEILDERLAHSTLRLWILWELTFFPSTSSVLMELMSSLGIRTPLLVGDG